MPMTYSAFLKRIIDDGIAAAKADYTHPEKAHMLRGSIAGFEACRGKTPHEIAELLIESRKLAQRLYFERDEDPNAEKYWEANCFALEVEWVANVLSAGMTCQMGATELEKAQAIVPPTARGVMKAAEILGAGTA